MQHSDIHDFLPKFGRMKITIDLRSALVGLVAGVVLMFTLGAAGAAPTGSGRYQVSTGADHGLLVDTATGQVWSARLNEARFNTDAVFKQAK